MGSEQAVDYSQGLPTPATTEGLGFITPLVGFVQAILPVAAVAGGLIIVASLAKGAESSGLLSGMGSARKRGRQSKMTRAARTFIQRKIRKIMHEEKKRPMAQAVRIAHEMARQSGYKVPPAPK